MDEIFKPILLQRKRIDEILSGISETPLLVISSSMGYGKTTALKQFFSRRCDIDTVWFTAPSGFNDGAYVWDSFCNAVEASDKGIGKMIRQFVNMHKGSFVENEPLLLPGKRDRLLVLIVDDYQNITDPKFGTIIENFLRLDDMNIHIVLSGRGRPSFGLEELMIKGLCTLVTQKVFSFTKEETREFFELNEVELDDGALEETYSYTDGWVSATYLSLIKYKSGGSVDIISGTSLLKTAVFDRMSPGVQRVLLNLAPLDSFSPELAEYVTQDGNAPEYLSVLAEENCFVKYNENQNIYTMHSMLRTLLEKMISGSGVEKKQVYDASGSWCRNRGMSAQAVDFFFKSGNVREALATLEKSDFKDTFAKIPSVISALMKDTGPELMFAYPRAYIMYIYMLSFVMCSVEAHEYAKYMSELFEKDYMKDDRDAIIAESLIIEALSSDDGMLGKLRRAQELLVNKKSFILKKENSFNITDRMTVYRRLLSGLTLDTVAEELVEEARLINALSDGCASNIENQVMAEKLFYRASLKAAEQHALKAYYKSKRENFSQGMVRSGYMVLKVRMLQGAEAKPSSEVDEILHQLTEHGISQGSESFNPVRVILNTMEGNICDRAMTDFAGEMFGVSEDIINECELRQLYSKARYAELEVCAEELLARSENTRNKTEYIRACVYLAVAKEMLGLTQEAETAMLAAADVAEGDHISVFFAELSDCVMPILERVSGNDVFVNDVVLRKCTECLRAKGTQYKKKGGLLSEREREIAKLMAQGCRQSEIAEQLFISLATVKKHTSNIYTKLNVSNKTMALKMLAEAGEI